MCKYRLSNAIAVALIQKEYRQTVKNKEMLLFEQ